MSQAGIRIGIYGVSTQSGRAFFADFLAKGLQVYGYARPTEHGRRSVTTFSEAGGIYLERPPNNIGEQSRFIPLGESQVGHDLDALIASSEVIFVPHPSQYLEESAQVLKERGLVDRGVPLVLTPPRTLAAPYLWRILGEDYPLISFATSPYSAKALEEGVYIKRRKRSWMASLEGQVKEAHQGLISRLFPQALFSHIPATTALGNLGAVFHPGGYLLNYDAIQERQQQGESYSFYMEGIAARPEVGEQLEAIDQTRLRIARALEIPVFGLHDDPKEEEWQEMMTGLHRAEESIDEENIQALRETRHACLQTIYNAVVSAQHWLDYSYGVTRIPDESLSDAIGRTTTYQKRSVPQERYLDEDIPTGLVPLEALAKRLEIECSAVSDVLDLYAEKKGCDPRASGRNLQPFNTDYLVRHLQGKPPCDSAESTEEVSGHHTKRSDL